MVRFRGEELYVLVLAQNPSRMWAGNRTWVHVKLKLSVKDNGQTANSA
jgi:hypothetical protein